MDTTANKGGMVSRLIAEVLTAFLLEDDYETALVDDITSRWALIRDIPFFLFPRLGKETLLHRLNAETLQPHRNAIITKNDPLWLFTGSAPNGLLLSRNRKPTSTAAS